MKSLGVFAYDHHDSQGELNSGEILVTENTCMSVREILERFSKGIPIGDSYRNLDEGAYIDDSQLDSMTSPDYSADKADMAQYVKDHSFKAVGGDDGDRTKEQGDKVNEEPSDREKETPDPQTARE